MADPTSTLPAPYQSGRLKPCPFCGSEAQADNSDDMWAVFCTKCPASMAFFKTYDGAVILWNRRRGR